MHGCCLTRLRPSASLAPAKRFEGLLRSHPNFRTTDLVARCVGVLDPATWCIDYVGSWAGGMSFPSVRGPAPVSWPKSNTVTGVIGRVRGKNRFDIFRVFKRANLEFRKSVGNFTLFSFMWLLVGGAKSNK